MKESSDGFVRADQIDLKSIDEQLERHLNKVLTMEKKKNIEEEDGIGGHVHVHTSATTSPTASSATPTKFRTTFKKQKQEWEIDPSKLIIKSVIARGTFGTVHRGIYDTQDVAGKFVLCFFVSFLFNFNIWGSILLIRRFRCLIPLPPRLKLEEFSLILFSFVLEK